MPVYSYVAKTRDGREVRDFLAADSRAAALSELKEQGVTVLELTEKDAETLRDVPKPSPVPKTRRSAIPSGRVSLSEKAMFCRQMAISVSAGVPLRDALESITEDMEHPGFKRILESSVQSLHDGKTFSESLAPHKAVFPP